MRTLFAAIRFLTVLPIPDSWGGDEKTLARSVPCFPLVGLLIGLIAAGFDDAVGRLLPPLPASTLTILVLICLTGALHMDGLADTADGFFSARPRDKMMDIMRDSRTGVMGVLAVVFVVLMKVTLLVNTVTSVRWIVILVMPLAGRTAIVTLMTALPYAREEGGLATLFAGRRSWLHVLWSWGLLFAVSGGLAQGLGLVAVFPALVITVLFVLFNRSKIGGYTGDTLGAVCELAETALLLAVVMYDHLWVR